MADIKAISSGIEPEPFKTERHTWMSSNPKEMLDKYLVESIHKNWTEDFVDEQNGEVVTIERSEVLVGRGLITQRVLTEIQFAMQSEGIAEVEISDEQEKAQYYTSYCMAPTIATVMIAGDKFKILLYARGIESALEIIKDYMAQYVAPGRRFRICEIGKSIAGTVIDNYTQRILDEREKGKDESTKDVYYNVTISMWNDIDQVFNSKDFFVRADDADLARAFTKKYIDTHKTKDGLGEDWDGLYPQGYTFKNVKQYAVDLIINKDFSKAYVERQEKDGMFTE